MRALCEQDKLEDLSVHAFVNVLDLWFFKLIELDSRTSVVFWNLWNWILLYPTLVELRLYLVLLSSIWWTLATVDWKIRWSYSTVIWRIFLSKSLFKSHSRQTSSIPQCRTKPNKAWLLKINLVFGLHMLCNLFVNVWVSFFSLESRHWTNYELGTL